MATIKITTGLKTYDIEDENGTIRGQISFNPSDMNFLVRANKAKTNIIEILDDVEKSNDEDWTDEETLDYIERCDAGIKEEINKLFDDPNTSKVVFGNQNCLNTLNGITFIERFLDVTLPIVEADYTESQKESVERIEKYTSQVE